ncbi:MAG TPA: carboxypeptidase regulatory-like domain-containing protein [Ignavibacteriaceae bacterium]|nr:carboxypeptidase regulatory-like domain-containing protein [Ignavibacteriaceae bacterium]
MRVKYILSLLILVTITSCTENTVSPVLYGSISGIVYAPNGNTPLAGANITTNPATSAIVSDAAGRFALESIPVGNYSISVVKNGYNITTVSVAVLANKSVQAVVILNDGNSFTPGIPSNPFPANQATNQSISLKLSWHNNASTGFYSDTTSFDVYLYESGSAVKQLIASGIKDTSTEVSKLKFNTTYFWQVTARGTDTLKANSEIWSFTTMPVPDNSILFSRIVNGNFQVFSSDTGEVNLVQLTDNNNRNWWPRFNPVHDKIAFTSNSTVDPQIYTKNNDGSGLFKVTTVSVTGYGNNGIGFSWSPDGYHILYSHNDKLYRIGSDGSNLTLIATAPAGRNFRECGYSLDGSKIVVLTVGANIYDSEIYTMNSDGSNMILLVSNSVGGTASPSFSIDGSKILYTHDVSGYQSNDGRMLNSHIFEIDVNTKSIVDLSTVNQSNQNNNKQNGTNDLNPRYSPNGANIIFENGSNVLNSAKDLWTMSVNGNNRIKIISNAVMPDWK